ncbi:RNA polymerase sigma factor [Porphyromonas sp.]|uniref:RNA polymerase sigma factor n=1 Tax=Porphyromonas sp. TaxID=1924944 RepID=UPI0026DD87C8|nr:sigma-70 family RNA polymerase sigma factor [Porphyromonas sp.]MDO4771227.1 sigma-70 family RNA polymerase sigma factor [Porphyromonas sp.]
MLKKDSEEILIKKILNGEQNAMRGLYDKYSGVLSTTCRRYIPYEDDMKDVLQDAFIKIFDKLNTFQYRGEGSLLAWMTRVVVNEALKHLRDTGKRNIVSSTWDLPDVSEEDEPDGVSNIPPEKLLEAIQQLPDGYRAVFNLYVFEQKSHKEIAQLLDINEASSASQYHRAKKALKKRINELIKQHQNE